ncbi:immunoglobulin kappa light chain-like [Podarcis lilfordi]|nr:immunoglobulin kappa light chain-like [Podarcis lilfordi]
MQFPQCLILICTDTGSPAQLECFSTESVEDKGLSFSWYKRREDGTPLFIKKCSEKEDGGRFACEAKGQNLVLAITKAQKEDTGLYMCAKRNPTLTFSNGSSLVVGDSYTQSTWVKLLQSAPREASRILQSNKMACVVHGASSFVQVSWDVPGHLWPETLLMRSNRSSWTFVSVLHIPLDLNTSAANFTCEVRFNSSGAAVRMNAEFPAAPSAVLDNQCLSFSVSLSVLAVLTLLMLLLSFLWIRRSRFRLGRHLLCPAKSCFKDLRKERGSEYQKWLGSGIKRL